MLSRKSITFVIKEQKSVFIQMHRNSLYWTMPTILMNTSYNIFKGINFIARKFNWINIKHASIIFSLKVKCDNQITETIFCEISTVKNPINIYELSNNPMISFQRFIPLSELNIIGNKTVYIKHYLNFMSQKEGK